MLQITLRRSNTKTTHTNTADHLKKIKHKDNTHKHCGSPQEDHAHSGDGGRGGTAQIVCLKQEVDVGAKLDSLSRGHGQETVVVQDGIERLYPLWVNVAVTDNPRLNL